MRSFLKILFACLTAIALSMLILFFMGVALFKTAAEPDKPELKAKTVLVIDLSKPIMEQGMEAGLSLPEGKTPEILGLFDIVRALQQAATDSLVKGVYLKCGSNSSGFATSNEIRNQLLKFKKSGKFIIAASDYISERAYQVANVSDRIYCQPQGMVDWKGNAITLTYFKGALDKLEIEPEIFYAGQFKSATEPFRLTKMSEPNRVQLTTFMEDLYQRFLINTANSRKIDTATLRSLANNLSVRTAEDATRFGLTDAAKYDDEVKSEIRTKLGIKADDQINMMPIGDYIKNGRWNENKEGGNIAIIYAEGEIVDGAGDDNQIGGDRFRNLLRKARMDKNIRAVVLRVNSPGGSAVASESIWREVMLCRKEKPLVVSMGDYAASGGYYISCFADSIFAQPNTLTGSIGVFSMYFDAQQMFNNKLGITFDRVKTAEHADYGTPFRPMTDEERQAVQAGVDNIYGTFKKRVAEGRKLNLDYVDSVAQGRIWSGQTALGLKLVDRIGGLQDAIDCASRMAKMKSYQLKEWPVVESFWKKVLGSKEEPESSVKTYVLKQQLGADGFALVNQFKTIQNWSGVAQMRLPFFASFK
ncbi:MAG: signal peptide peptidase SppA [Bacteroidota bacterium]